MAVISGVTCLELRESFTEGIAEGGPHASKAYLCNWVDRYTVANGLLGLSTLSGGVNGTITFTHPYPYPESYNMWAREVSIRGVGKCTQGPRQIAWDKAAILVNYAVPQYSLDQISDPGGLNSFDPSAPLIYASQRLSRGCQVLDLKPGTLTLQDGLTNPKWQQGYGMFIGVNTMHLTLHSLPYLPSATLRAEVGSVNSVAIWGCAIGTLRWDGPDTNRTFNNDGTFTQEVSHAFAHRPIAPWDQVLHPNGTSGWKPLKYNGASILPSFDFHTLIPTAYGGTG